MGPVWSGSENLTPLKRVRTPDRPARLESLYRLSYPGNQTLVYSVHAVTWFLLYIGVEIRLSH